MASTPSYWDYLKLDQLLDLQSGLDETEDGLLPDELHFIIVHQVYELWFKLVIRSIRLARDELAKPTVAEEVIPRVAHHLRRVSRILSLCVDQFDVMETLTPQDFLAFRDKLVPSSGFQSFQMREMEILLGLDESQRILYGKVDPLEHIREMGRETNAGRLAWKRIVQARSELSVLEALNEWLYRTPIQGSQPDDANDEQVVTDFLEAYLDAADKSHDAGLERLVAALGEEKRETLQVRVDATRTHARRFLFAEDIDEGERPRIRRIRAAVLFIESYRELPLLAWPRLLLDLIVQMEQQLLLFRNRHARMVERIIGRRPGTGGSEGVGYLDKTLSYRVFVDLWAIRTALLPKSALPPLENPKLYGFAG
ncbi:MAG: tryptophan 2,3-dioxygenase [Deltaproteobacteria bacterium]|nr:MAG: tryptophan 2,3-dioxygenase [Deltaproteobacteria bacterium]